LDTLQTDATSGMSRPADGVNVGAQHAATLCCAVYVKPMPAMLQMLHVSLQLCSSSGIQQSADHAV